MGERPLGVLEHPLDGDDHVAVSGVDGVALGVEQDEHALQVPVHVRAVAEEAEQQAEHVGGQRVGRAGGPMLVGSRIQNSAKLPLAHVYSL